MWCSTREQLWSFLVEAAQIEHMIMCQYLCACFSLKTEPPGVEFALLPFGADSLTRFLYLERPEGVERVDATEFVSAAPPPGPVIGAEVMPRAQGFLTVAPVPGDRAGSERSGQPTRRTGPVRGRAAGASHWPQLIAVTDLASAGAAIGEIIDQGERLVHDRPEAITEPLSRTPPTFLPGDWKLGNLGSHPDGRTILPDWTLPGAGPACW